MKVINTLISAPNSQQINKSVGSRQYGKNLRKMQRLDIGKREERKKQNNLKLSNWAIRWRKEEEWIIEREGNEISSGDAGFRTLIFLL